MDTHKQRVRALNALMVYSTYTSRSPTESQKSKFFDSLRNSVPAEPEFIDFVVNCRSALPMYSRDPHPKDPDLIALTSSRVPLKKGGCLEEDIVTWLPDNASDGYVRRAVMRYDAPFKKLKPFMEKFLSATPDWNRTPRIGNISYIQEPGYKLRAVANPNRLIQFALEPLKDAVWSLLAKIPEDCTFDQEKGIKDAHTWVQTQDVYSVDLSDATNHFPLELQLRLVEKSLPPSFKPYLDLFEFASRGHWKTPEGEFIQWTKGQPLGLGPSFGMFALGHHAVLRSLQKVFDGDYRILGDDIVIIGKDLYKHYRRSLQRLGCPVSESKTLAGARVAEFGGRVIVPSGVITTFKWRQPSDRSFISCAQSLGPKSLPLFRPRQRKVLKELAIVPDVIGGLGWNPKGLPLSVRLDLPISQKFLARSSDPFKTVVKAPFSKAMLRFGSYRSSLNDLVHNKGIPGPSATTIPGRDRAILDRIIEMTGQHEARIPVGFHAEGTSSVPRGDPRGKDALQLSEQLIKELLAERDRQSPGTDKSPVSPVVSHKTVTPRSVPNPSPPPPKGRGWER
jgi:hypothetical protein